MTILQEIANAIRFLSIDAVEKSKSGHPGMPMGMADVATVLFHNHLVFNPAEPNWPNRDRFVLSAGHGSMLLYSLLYLTGYEDSTLEQLMNFRALGSKTAGHPEYGHLSGVETTTGPLGQGIANSVGMALAERMLNARYGDAINHHVYVIASDGDMMEGISHEAASLAGHLGLRKLIVLYDDNGISIEGKTELSFSDNTLQRFEAYGWKTDKIDGHDFKAIDEAITRAKSNSKPTLIACKTTIGFGSPNKANTNGVHGSPLGENEVSATRKALNWPYAPFEVPERILQTWRNVGLKGKYAHLSWQQTVSQNIKDAIEDAASLRAAGVAIHSYKQQVFENKPNVATRVLSQQVLDILADKLPLVGGSADLSPSNNTKAKSQIPITKADFSGNYIHYGVREHAMAAIMNGLSLSKAFIPYGGTFLVFLDYLKPALRLSAIMNQGVVYVMTHDSIGLGEDGPTHQPIEHLAHLRCIPNVLTLRPMDAIEVAECWQIALENRNTPSVLVLSRQNLPFLSDKRANKQGNLSAKGAYAIIDTANPKVILMATGSEVSIAHEAAIALKANNIEVRLISVPCMELFEKQPQAYKDSLLKGAALKIAVEAAAEGVWRRYIGNNGIFIGMESFGASAPAPDLYQHFGITAERIIKAVEAKLLEKK
jgi:transketolase